MHACGNPGANLKSISHKCYLFEVAFEWELTKETIGLPLGCQSASSPRRGADYHVILVIPSVAARTVLHAPNRTSLLRMSPHVFRAYEP